MGQNASQNMFTDNVLLLGNPGCGKTAMLRCLSGGKRSFGFGQAYSVDARETASVDVVGGRTVNFLSSPGLCDPEFRTQFLVQLRAAMERDVFKIIFVVELEAGRPRERDICLINLVLRAFPDIKTNYGIIINKLSKREKKRFLEEPARLKSVLGHLTESPREAEEARPLPQHYILLPRNDDLEDDDDVVIRLPEHDEIMTWVQALPNWTGSVQVQTSKEKAKDLFQDIRDEMEEEFRRL